jgi:hypothetical protein
MLHGIWPSKIRLLSHLPTLKYQQHRFGGVCFESFGLLTTPDVPEEVPMEDRQASSGLLVSTEKHLCDDYQKSLKKRKLSGHPPFSARLECRVRCIHFYCSKMLGNFREEIVKSSLDSFSVVSSDSHVSQRSQSFDMKGGCTSKQRRFKQDVCQPSTRAKFNNCE